MIKTAFAALAAASAIAAPAAFGVGVTEALGVYGELSFVGSGSDSIDRGYAAKSGIKYSF